MAARTSVISSEKENVVIQAGACSVSVLPQFGGKLVSIQVNGNELLQAPLARISARTRTMAFDAGDASGWDECLPSVAACTVSTSAGQALVPDHGDLWRVAWEEQGAGSREPGTGNSHPGRKQKSDSIALRGECFSLPLALD